MAASWAQAGGLIALIAFAGALQAEESARDPAVVPRPALDEDVAAQLRALVERLEARVAALEAESEARQEALETAERELEQQQEALREAKQGLDAAEARLADQSARIRSLASDRVRGAARLTAFLERIEVRGAVAPSYNWNFNNPDSQPAIRFPDGFGPGDNSPAFPQTKHNTVQLDQARLAIARPAVEDDRAGFAIEVLYGVSADPVGGSDTPIIQQAFVSWRPPIPGEIELRFGRFDSPIGAEVIYVGENFNVTRGLVWSFQPWNHDGLLASGAFGGGFSWKLGLANNGSAVNFDNNNGKTALAQIAWEDEERRISLSYMAEDGPLRGPFASFSPGRDSDRSHLLDLVAFWDPHDRVSIWLDALWIRSDIRFLDESDAIAAALAGRVALTTKTGVALRGEWARLWPGDGQGVSSDAIWLTGTLDHALTSRLSLRGELAWFFARNHGGPDTFFINGAGSARTKPQQTIALVQAIYFF